MQDAHISQQEKDLMVAEYHVSFLGMQIQKSYKNYLVSER